MLRREAMIRILLLLVLLANPAFANDINCLAITIYHESRGEPLAGQYAVAYVILNRTENKNFPNTICGVVKQKNQFYGYKPRTKIKDRKAWEQANRVAKASIKLHDAGFDTTNGALYFNTSKKGIRIGNHGFY
jgi:spore germination cell wall hydrolase CwlJ-like protein